MATTQRPPRRGSLPDDPDVVAAKTPPPEEEVEVEEDTSPTPDPQEEPGLSVEDIDEPLDLADLDPSTPLFEGGPTVGNIEDWKKEFGPVYVTQFDADVFYVWRTLNRFEYRRLVKQLEQQVASGQVTQAEANMNNEEAICELCLLWPQITRADMASHMAGISSIIAQEVMEASAFVALEVRQL